MPTHPYDRPSRCVPWQRPLAALAAAAAWLLPASAQQPTPAPAPEPPAAAEKAAPAVPVRQHEPHYIVRRYPQDRDVPVAVVADQPITLGELVDHLDERHHPGFRQALEVRPEIQRMLQSDLIAPWVRQFADLAALRHVTKDAPPDPKQLEEAQSAELKRTFQGWLDTYTANRRADGRPTELTQQQVNRFLADFQLRQGIAAELQGFLDAIVPDDFTRPQLQQFFQDNARVFGGQVTISHILVQHRDAGTGILLDVEGQSRAAARLADIQARLRPDGSNFEEVARLMSEDTRTAKDGGVLAGIRRFDDRLPAALCRAAWSLRDGEVSDVVESQYGWHLVKRLDFVQHMFILFTEDAIPSIRVVMRRSRQEERLFDARKQANVRLLL